MNWRIAAVRAGFAIGVCASAATNELSDGEIEGRDLARQLLEQKPERSFTNTGVLKIRAAKGKAVQIPLTFKTIVTATNWEVTYEADSTNGVETLSKIWRPDQMSELSYHSARILPSSGDKFLLVFDHPFAGSDFSVGDLDLEFLGWIKQKVLKHEMRSGRWCKVLESTNPSPSTNGYSRVVSWIDHESGGIVQAQGYDARGKLLKEFEPKEFKKVNGQWELQEMEIRNVQTGSRTRLEFNLEKK